MTTASGGHNTYTCTYSDTTKKYTFAASNAFYFNWSLDTTNKGAYEQLGFNKGTDSSSGMSVTSTNVINLSNPIAVFVRLSECLTTVETANGFASGNIYLPVNSAYGSIATLELHNYPTKLKFNPVRTMTVRIADEKGRVRSLNGGSFSIQLEKCEH